LLEVLALKPNENLLLTSVEQRVINTAIIETGILLEKRRQDTSSTTVPLNTMPFKTNRGIWKRLGFEVTLSSCNKALAWMTYKFKRKALREDTI